MPIIRNAGTFDLPARPRLLAELTLAAERDDVTLDQIADLVESDPGLAAAVVKSSNSAFHTGGTRSIASVRQAIQVLGLRDLIALATGAFLRRAFPSSTPQIEQLWSLSTDMAEACAGLAHTTRAAPRDVAYSFGLFRFVGCAVLLLQAPNYKKTFELLDSPDFAQQERTRHGITHAQVGAGLVVRWGMSKDMVEAVSAAADIALLENLPITPQARGILAIGAQAQMRVMPKSVEDIDAVAQACARVFQPA